MPLSQYSLKLAKKEHLTEDIIELHFEKPPGMEFLAGQFLQFMIPDGTKMVPRSYSISSAPSDEDLEFCVKILPNGKASGHFSRMKVGQSVMTRGPLGHFVHKGGGSIECVATGAGITPIMGIIRDELVFKQNNNPIHLLFGVRHKKDIFWQERLEELNKQYDNFSYQLTLSQGDKDHDWDGLVGRVTKHIRKEHIENKDFYLCGSPDMVKDVRHALFAIQVDKKKVHLEIF